MSQYVCTHKRKIKIPAVGVPSKFFNEIFVDCGKCRACRLKRRNAWATRLVTQWQHTPNSLWCLFTYDNDHIPVFNQLGKKRISAFMKRLRRWFDYHWHWKGVKFFCSGEYGTINKRPHFHVILFNVPPCPYGYVNKVCPSIKYQLEMLWKQGFVKVKKLESVEQCYYCAKYAVKGLSEHEDVEPCILFSKGLGKDYVIEHLDELKKKCNDVLNPKSAKLTVGKFTFYLDSVKLYKNLIYNEIQLKAKLFDYLLNVELDAFGVPRQEREKFLWSLHCENLVNLGLDTYEHLERRK